jgi:hypothetical protein
MSEKTPGPKAPLYRNVISLGGTIIVAGATVLIVLATAVDLLAVHRNPYVGIFTYMVMPAFFGLGGLVFLYGMRWEAKRRKRLGGLPQLPYPAVDLNVDWQRRLFGWVLVGGAVVATVAMWAVANGYHFTESVTFCGQVCHAPMEPEATAHRDSPHARVACVDCHVGEGAEWYMRSKISGAHQVLAVALNNFHRPIETPLKHLRPARETCETCHWPEKFFGSKLLQLPHYRYDEANSAEQISLVLKTGGGSIAHGASQGIHWHMMIANKVTYVATDDKRLDIPWVRMEHADGSVDEYRIAGVTDEQIAGLEHRQMDCMDCHNRPSHNFPPPEAGMNDALYRGRVKRDLPFIMKVGVEALTKRYDTKQAAHDGIRNDVQSFYAAKYPAVVRDRAADLEQAIVAIIAVHDRSTFHDMKVDSQTYPSHIGHRFWPGCFRCHDGRHASASGKVISHECNGTCHTQPVRSQITPLGVVEVGTGANWHAWQMSPEYVEIEAHSKLLCSTCHRAGERPYKDCADCHTRL